VQAHIPEVFQDLGHMGEDIGRVRASALQTILRVLGGSGGGLFGYAALPTEPPLLIPPWDQSMGSSGYTTLGLTAGGSPELPNPRLLANGNRRLHSASPHLVGFSRGAPQSVAGGRREEESRVRMESPVLIPDAMDSHMHLDRSLRRLRLDPSVRHPPLSRRSTWWGGGLL
jgi:hypothetical protein